MIKKPFVCFLVLFLSAGVFGCPNVNAAAAKGLSVYGQVPNFRLTDAQGKAFGASDLVGRVWIADFVYTRCSDECPLLSARISKLQKLDKMSKVTFVSFSIDPNYDTPKVLTAYAKQYGARAGHWFFLTGSTTVIKSLGGKTFHLPIITEPKSGQILGHSNYFTLIDKQGKIRGYYDSSRPEELDALVKDAFHLQ